MARISPSAPLRQSPPQRSARRILLPAALLGSLMWHLLAFNWANGLITFPALQTEPTVITTELRPPPVIAAKPAAPIAAQPKRKPKPRPAAPPPPPVADTTVASSSVTDAPAASADAVPEPVAVAETEAAAPSIEAPQQVGNPSSNYKFDLPPPAELKYELQAKREGNQWFGTGMFLWHTNGGSYVITGEASVTILFKISVLNFRSEGAINAFGIAPVLYSEKPWRKSMTNTHFLHEDRKISFSASQAVYPYKGGEQDRASIMWQLAGIGRGDPAQFAPGVAFDILVAGARDANTWRIDVVGLEEIDTPHAKIMAWHVVRAPKPGSYDQKIDIWLAPQHEWYPAKVRFTYANGDYLDMLLAELTPRVATAPTVPSSGNE